MKYTIEWSDTFYFTPIAYDIHHPKDGKNWFSEDQSDQPGAFGCDIFRAPRPANAYKPPLPNPVPGKGHPVVQVKTNGLSIAFGSLLEIDHAINVLSEKVLKKRSVFFADLKMRNQHWLSRFPANLKSWTKRQKIVKDLKKVRNELAKRLEAG